MWDENGPRSSQHTLLACIALVDEFYPVPAAPQQGSTMDPLRKPNKERETTVRRYKAIQWNGERVGRLILEALHEKLLSG